MYANEIFLNKIQFTTPPTYLLKDAVNVDIFETYYEKQLQKVKYADGYLVKTLIKRKDDRCL